jgi:KaiC/GvpD/RAD55 family RecA-like ATPase
MLLLVGSPGAGKSTFCHQVALKSLVVDKPIIYVTTKYGSSETERTLKERGLREVERALSAVRNQHVKERKCIAMGNPYCEWEFR